MPPREFSLTVIIEYNTHKTVKHSRYILAKQKLNSYSITSQSMTQSVCKGRENVLTYALTRVCIITRSAPAHRWESDGFDALPKPLKTLKVVPITAMSDA